MVVISVAKAKAERTEKAGVHPRATRIMWNGKMLISCPNWPNVPVSWVRMGIRDPENHSGSSFSTETKTMASPMPTMTRPTSPMGTLVEMARNAWPAVISIAPVVIRMRGPKRSKSNPTGTCAPA